MRCSARTGLLLQVEMIDCAGGLSEWQGRLTEAEQQGDIVAQVGIAFLIILGVEYSHPHPYEGTWVVCKSR
jgi:hypothetical protein